MLVQQQNMQMHYHTQGAYGAQQGGVQDVQQSYAPMHSPAQMMLPPAPPPPVNPQQHNDDMGSMGLRPYNNAMSTSATAGGVQTAGGYLPSNTSTMPRASMGAGEREFEPLLAHRPGISPTCPRHGRAALAAMQMQQQGGGGGTVEEIQV